MKELLAQLRRYRLPIALGAGAVVAYAAYTGAQQRAAAAARAAAAQAPAPLGPEQYTGLIGFGAETALRGQSGLLGVAQGGLNLGGLAVQGALGVAEAATGLAVPAAITLGDVAGQLVQVVAAPLAAAKAAAIPVAPPPVFTPAPQPAPQPAPSAPAGPTVVATETEYRVSLYGWVQTFAIDAAGNVKDRRRTPFSDGGSSAPATRETAGGVHWRISAGGMMGWSLVPGGPAVCMATHVGPPSCGVFSVSRITYQRLSDGSRRLVGESAIDQSGS